MADKELIEFAAKAAGLAVKQVIEHDGPAWAVISLPEFDTTFVWDPLGSFEDAFCLMTDLDLNVYQAAESAFAVQIEGDGEVRVRYHETSGDKRKATRRAIVMAAALIGGME